MFDTHSLWQNILEEHRTEVILGVIAFIIFLGSAGIFITNFPIETKSAEIEFKPASPTSLEKSIFIDISGAVKHPDVYSIRKGSRLKDIIQKAGGFTEEANKTYIAKNFNLSKILNDQDKVYIPSTEETTEGLDSSTFISEYTDSNTNSNVSKKINLNTGSLAELESLPGVGIVTAQKIIDNRPYDSIEELSSKNIVKATLYSKIEQLIEL